MDALLRGPARIVRTRLADARVEAGQLDECRRCVGSRGGSEGSEDEGDEQQSASQGESFLARGAGLASQDSVRERFLPASER